MSEEWENSRMEAEIFQAATERLKKQTITGEWKINITAKGAKASEIINEFVTELIKLEKEFTGDDVTTEVDPIIKQIKNDD